MAVKNRLISSRKPITILLITAVLAVVSFGAAKAVSAQQDIVEVENPLTLNISLSPTASTPGERVSLTLSLRNVAYSAATPEVIIQLPDEVSPDVSTLPPGTNYNFQTGGLFWQPYIEPLGGKAQIEIWLSVKAVRMNEAERTISVVVRNEGQETVGSSTLWIGSRPQAYIVFDPPQVAVGQPVRLLAKTAGAGPTTQTWSLDDGRIVAAYDPEIVFASSGTHVVTLQISNPLGATVVSDQINVLPQPVAQFSTQDNSTISESAIVFINESGGEPPLRYSWTFGDGTFSTEKNPSHRYNAPGLYQVGLAVENDHGRSETSSFVQIGTPPEFEIVTPEYGNVGQAVHGEIISDKPSTEFSWDMGDGRYYSGPQIDHRYWTAGDYILTVTARNEFGETRVSKWIRIGYDILYYYIPFMSTGKLPDGNLMAAINSGALEGTVNIGLGQVPELEPIEFAPGSTPAERLFIYINEARSLYNLRPLTYVHSLSVAAQAHTDDMAVYGFTAHVGSDGSTPAYRLQLAGYNGGYGGEATAWGMSDPIEPVQFWLTSPSHRAIILNPAASEVGVGFTTNFDAPNVWYWTAEFASIDLPVVGAPPPQAAEPEMSYELLLLGPPQSSEVVLSADAQLNFSWSWHGGVQEYQRFALYLSSGGRTFQTGVVRGSQSSGQYHFSADVSSFAVSPGLYSWQVKLEDSGQGIIVTESPIWQVYFANSSSNQTGSVSPQIPTPLPSATPEQSSPADNPAPDQDTLPVATPIPTKTS
jgi:PKD repeat protein